MSEKLCRKRKNLVEALPLSFYDITSIIKSGDSVKLDELIKEGIINDINMPNNVTYPSQNLLSVACKCGFVDCAEVLLNNGANVNYRDRHNDNIVLESALGSCSLDMIKLVMRRGVAVDDKALLCAFRDLSLATNTEITDILLALIKDVNYSSEDIYNRRQSSFLYYASRAGSLSATHFLLECGATQLATALRGASCYGHIEVIKVLLRETKDKEGLKDAYVEASKYGQLAVVQFLFEYDAEYTLTSSQGASFGGEGMTGNKQGKAITMETIESALVAASPRKSGGPKRKVSDREFGDGHIYIMKFLIDNGADAQALNAALYHAVWHSSIEAVELLINSGADVNFSRPRQYHRNTLENPLLIACSQGRSRIVRLLLAHGADPNDRRVPSPLLAAFNPYRGAIEVIQLLLMHGADPNDQRAATSPLEAALQRPEALRALLQHGANANLLFSNGKTALLEVLERAHTTSLEAFTLLLQHQADPNLADAHTGETPLMVAATACRVEYVKLLLVYGADVTQVNTAGRSVLDMLGKTRKYSEVVELWTSYVETNRPGEKHVLK